MAHQGRLSEASVQEATRHGWKHWMHVLDAYGPDLDHTARARRLADAHPDLPGWWCQGITVEYELRRGLRVPGESTGGGFQVTCSKTLAGSPDDAWAALLAAQFLLGATWKEDAEWEVPGEGRVLVRAVRPGKLLRWFWYDDHGKSTVEVDLQPRGDRTAVRFSHHGLSAREAVERYRARWKTALATVAERAG